MNRSVRGHVDEGCQNRVPPTTKALRLAAADTAAPKSEPREGSACVLGHMSISLGHFLWPHRGRRGATTYGYDWIRPKMLILSVFYKMECSLQKKDPF